MKNLLFLVVLVSQSIFASALFDRSNANLWLVEADGAISSYSNGDWLFQFNPTIYSLRLGEQALINEIPASSIALNDQLAPLSLTGLGEASLVIGQDSGGNKLLLYPQAGSYQQTIEVMVRVDADLVADFTHLTLTGQDNGTTLITRLIDNSIEVVEGYVEFSVFLVNEGNHLVYVELRDDSNTVVATLQREYIISNTDGPDRDTDLDGLPDVVEQAIGLNPLQGDWQTDSNNDGWGDFDQWLRSTTSDKTEIPVDTDQDGWSDFDEDLRGTNPNDSVQALLTSDPAYPAPTFGTQQYDDTLLRFKEHPLAQRLYAAEYRITASKQIGVDAYSWNSTVSSSSLFGDRLFDSEGMLSDQDLLWADVESVDIADSLKQSVFVERLQQNQVANFRVAASLVQVLDVVADETVIVDAATANEHEAVRRWHYQAVMESMPDLIPSRFTPSQGWVTAEEWKQLYLDYLQQNLVIDKALELSLDSSLGVEAFKLLLDVELEFQGGYSILDWSQLQAAQQQQLRQLSDDLSGRENRRNLYAVYSELQNLLTVNGLTQTTSWLQDLQSSVTEAVDVSLWLQQQALQSSSVEMELFRYLGRFTLFADGLSQLNAQSDLAITTSDTDSDGLNNLYEVARPFSLMTYPWMPDSDGDQLIDSLDNCATGENNLCHSMPQLQISTSATIDEPLAGQSQSLLVSFQLDRATDQDVSFTYSVTASGLDSATPGVDFTELTGELTINAGDKVVFIAVPVLADSDFSEGSESFHIELSNAVNAFEPANQSTVTISPAISLASNADLSALTISAGTLDQLFQASQLSYTVSVNYTVTSTTLTATASDPAATLTLNGNPLDSGLPSDSIALSEGPNLVEIEVTAEDSSTQTYSITINRQNAATYAQQAYIKASNTGADDQFGKAIAISGDTLVVGAFQESGDVNSADGFYNDDALYAGAVYVFTRTSGVWTQQAYLKASNAQSGDQFGAFVALDGDTLAVGAPGEDGDASSNNTGYNDLALDAGAAYIFTRNSGIWTQQAYIKADSAQADDQFGEQLALDGNSLVVGAIGEDDGAEDSGAVYVFTRDSVSNSWSQQERLKASNVQAFTLFGSSVDYESDTLAVGAIFDDGDAVPLSGAVYVFTRTAGVWTQQAYLKAENAEALDYFGGSVALSGDTLAIGAYGEDGDEFSSLSDYNNNASGSGAVYVFTRSSGLWTQQAYIKAPNVDAGDQFGQNLDLEIDSLAVAATLEDGDPDSSVGNYNNNTSSAGAVYYFARSGSNWNLLSYIKASNAEANDRFGSSLHISGDTLVSGAYGEDSAATNINGDQSSSAATDSGAAYVFQ